MASPGELSEIDEWWLRAAGRGPRLGRARTRAAGWALVAAELADELGEVGRLAAQRGFVLTPQELAAAGVDDATRRRALRSGRWSSPRRGFVCLAPTRTDGRPGADDPEIAVAAAVRARAGSTASHESAAVLHGLPVLHVPRRTQLSTTRPSGGGGWPDLVLHVVGLPEVELTLWHGVPVTSVARTVVDVARRAGVAGGLVTADAALVESLTTEGELARSLRRAHGRPGMVGAAQAVELARAGSESPLESLVRLCVVDGGINAQLVLQAKVPTDRGTYRVDMLIAEHKVIIEADGALKYRDDRRALWKEKLRQDALERAGYRIVRVTWDDVHTDPAGVVARVLAACAAPDRPVF